MEMYTYTNTKRRPCKIIWLPFKGPKMRSWYSEYQNNIKT